MSAPPIPGAAPQAQRTDRSITEKPWSENPLGRFRGRKISDRASLLWRPQRDSNLSGALRRQPWHDADLHRLSRRSGRFGPVGSFRVSPPRSAAGTRIPRRRGNHVATDPGVALLRTVDDHATLLARYRDRSKATWKVVATFNGQTLVALSTRDRRSAGGLTATYAYGTLSPDWGLATVVVAIVVFVVVAFGVRCLSEKTCVPTRGIPLGQVAQQRDGGLVSWTGSRVPCVQEVRAPGAIFDRGPECQIHAGRRDDLDGRRRLGWRRPRARGTVRVTHLQTGSFPDSAARKGSGSEQRDRVWPGLSPCARERAGGGSEPRSDSASRAFAERLRYPTPVPGTRGRRNLPMERLPIERSRRFRSA